MACCGTITDLGTIQNCEGEFGTSLDGPFTGSAYLHYRFADSKYKQGLTVTLGQTIRFRTSMFPVGTIEFWITNTANEVQEIGGAETFRITVI